MAEIPNAPSPMPSQMMGVDEFNTAVEALFDFFPIWKAAVDQLGSEFSAMVDAKVYSGTITYNQTGYVKPSFVYGSDGFTYVCVGENIQGDNPVGSGSGAWISLSFGPEPRLTVPAGEYLTGGIIGGDYEKTGINELTVNALSCRDEDNIVPIFCDSQTVNIPTSANEIYILFACSDGVVRVDTYVDGANLSAYTKRRIGFVKNNSSEVVAEFRQSGEYLSFIKFSEATAMSGITTTASVVDLSGVIPVEMCELVKLGAHGSGAVAYMNVYAGPGKTGGEVAQIGIDASQTDINYAWDRGGITSSLIPIEVCVSAATTGGTGDLAVHIVKMVR
jgi:hypothetical protein